MMGDIIDRLWADVTEHVVAGSSTALWPLAAVSSRSPCRSCGTSRGTSSRSCTRRATPPSAPCSGGRCRGIRLHADTSGLTTRRGSTKRLPLALTAFAGYTAPAVLGRWCRGICCTSGMPSRCCGPWSAARRRAGSASATSMDSWWWYVSIGAFGWLAWAAPDSWRIGVAYGVAWLLLLGAVRAVVELHGSRRGRGRRRVRRRCARAADAVPGVVWVALFWLVTVACAAGGAWLMVG